MEPIIWLSILCLTLEWFYMPFDSFSSQPFLGDNHLVPLPLPLPLFNWISRARLASNCLSGFFLYLCRASAGSLYLKSFPCNETWPLWVTHLGDKQFHFLSIWCLSSGASSGHAIHHTPSHVSQGMSGTDDFQKNDERKASLSPPPHLHLPSPLAVLP